MLQFFKTYERVISGLAAIAGVIALFLLDTKYTRLANK